MFRLSAKWRINLGLIGLMASVILIAVSMEIVPDWRRVAAEGRSNMCQALAVSSSAQVSRNDIKSLREVLQIVVERNEDMRSAAIRRSDGRIIVAVGNHGQYWENLSDEASTDAQIRVPVWAHKDRWGDAEFCFDPLVDNSLFGFLWNPWTRFIAFVSAASSLAFAWYLRKMLAHLDPSKAVPGRVRIAFDTLAEGVVVLDSRERIVLANRGFATTVGKSQQALIGSRLSELPWSSSLDGDTAAELPWIRALRDGSSEEPGMWCLTNSQIGDRTYVVNCSAVQGQEGKSQGVLVSFEDVTPLEEKKVELSRAKAVAESASQAKTEFLANMSHEIRTPMNAILGFTDVLRRGFERNEGRRRDHLNTIHASGRHLLNLINDILDLSKVEAGRLELESVRCSPHQIVAEVIAVLRVRANEKGISLDYQPEGAVPETIETDPGRLRQTLMNLAGNAIKFTDHGGVRIACRMAGTSDKPKLAFDVVDSGIGMASEALDKIFEPFAQADGSVTRRFGGTGLGLAISRQFAEALGGPLTVTSQPGEGSQFSFSIDTGPLEGVAMLSAAEAARVTVADAQAAAGPQSLPQARILVVDDGDENRQLLALLLGEAGVNVEMADNGLDAVQMATRSPYDVILMDMQMPIMDGYTAARTLRDQGYSAPIVALTANAMTGDEDKCRKAGCSGFLTKPIDIDQLFETLTDILGVKTRETAATANEPAEAVPPASDDGPLVSTLPTHKPQFAAIVRMFGDRIAEQLSAMDKALAAGDLDQIKQLAHWLKGSGGNVGFHEFTEPARRLEDLAKQGKVEELPAAVARLHQLAGRIVMSPKEVPANVS